MSQKAYLSLPQLPGVYLFKDATNKVIYIGKAKNLRKRVSTYFQRQADDWKVHELIKEHATVEHIVTHTEHEALLLEARLIQELKPKYNTLLTAGNPFLYIVATATSSSKPSNLPELKIVRTKQEKGVYFGPFLKKITARRAYDYVMRTFVLNRCNVKIAEGCLEYHLGRCAGTCRPDFDEAGYRARVQLAIEALAGNHEAFLETLKEQLKRSNARHEFEMSRHLAEYAQNVEQIFAAIRARFDEKKYSSELEQATAPFHRPQDALFGGLEALKKMLNLAATPRTVDCFDISHMQGQEIVGSCIRFTDGVPEKDKFRRFKIKTLTDQNDYAALQEIVLRRYTTIKTPRDLRVISGNALAAEDLPDVILIDGGKGQRNAVKDYFPQIPCISLAKREEMVFSDEHPEGVKLDLHTPLGQLLIALRDYAHHFAISYHKLLRRTNLKRNT